MAETQDTEITLGTGRLLGLFFGLVVVCAIFFGLGFSLGRNSVKTGSLNIESTPATLPGEQASSVGKAPAGTPERIPVPPMDQTASVQPVAAAATQSSAPSVVTSPASSTPATNTPAPEMSKSASIAPGAGSFSVQVAAVSKEEDADALVDALKKKSYPVYVATMATDKLFHVQVGPFGDIKDAEAMKSKLLGDGYNPILKR
jgi:DedD protein